MGSRVSTTLDRAEDLQSAASSVLVPLSVTATRDVPFRARIDSASAGSVVIARVRSTPHAVRRSNRAISSTDADLLKVTLHRRGAAALTQAGRQHEVRAGELALLDTARPYQLVLPGYCDVVAIGVPRERLGRYAGQIGARAARPVSSDGSITAVIGTFLSGLGEHLGVLPPVSEQHLADAITALLIATFADTTPERVDTGTELVDRIIAYTMANLGDPSLSAGSVARCHGISTRYLHQLFRGRSRTFAAWVRYERLHRIHRDLLDPALADRTIAAIASRWGLTDAAHLGRAFKTEFGNLPVELRRAR